MQLQGTLTYRGVPFTFIWADSRLHLMPPERSRLAVQSWLAEERLMIPERQLSGMAEGKPVLFTLPADAAAVLTDGALHLSGVKAVSGQRGGRQVIRRALMLLCAAVFAAAAWNIGSYLKDLADANQASQTMRDAYYGTQEDAPTATPAPIPTAMPDAQATPVPTVTVAISGEATMRPNAVLNAVHATQAPVVILPRMDYPQNPYGVVSERFNAVRFQNPDVIGWLTIANLLDQAVVQRDNTYYLTHAYTGDRNVNGAIFLDQYTDIAAGRPYALALYGHNMKTGAMFGALRNYENLTFYKKNPFITCDTLYEDGRFVVFAVSTVSTDARDANYLDFQALNSRNEGRRQQAIATLKGRSIIQTPINVQPTDQLLLLITCVDEDEERRIVAARRIRDNETEAALLELVKSAGHR